MVVLPTPRTPVRIQACGIRPVSNAFETVRTIGVLADQIVETGGAVFARQHAIRLAGLRRAAEVEAALMGAFRIVGGH